MRDPLSRFISRYTYYREIYEMKKSEHYFGSQWVNIEQFVYSSISIGCKPFIPRVHIPSVIKHLVYYTTLGIVKINIFEHFKKYLNSTNIFLETDNNFTQW